ncbi:MAG: hypothetical protein COA47_07515 [Robiginitomaculum sp.]|nr:MAG: hypothetical protein COA47_07515 [Robiginitomaculum sp.]
MIEYRDVLRFWFVENGPAQWYAKDDEFDASIRERFFETHLAACQGELWPWRETAKGRLAEILVLDQFSRNLYREDARAYSMDGMALVLAQEAILRGLDQHMSVQERSIFYLPFMHSESLKIHEEAMRIFDELGLPDSIDFEKKHYDIIKEFGRYPHRNKVLGRDSTPQEIAFLTRQGSSF